jgi:dihydrofolate reductase
MRIVVSDFVSLDGVVQAPGGPGEDTDAGFRLGGWSMPYFDPDTMGPAVDDAMAATEALRFGRRTWQAMANAWPAPAGDPFANRMNEIPKYVASRTLTQQDLTWSGSTLLPAEDAIRAIRELRARDGKALLGGGKRLFPDDSQARALELVSATTTATGVLISTYRPADR